MSKTIINMVFRSRLKFVYLAIILLPSIAIGIHIYNTTLNFSILLLVAFIATFSSLIITLEILIQEEGTKVYSYLKILRDENYVMIYRTLGIYNISFPLTVFTFFTVNLIYIKEINVIQQLIYLVLIVTSNFFYIYFLQYVSVNLTNVLIRNVVIISVTGISILSLMTRSLSTYIMFVTMIGLFFAVTVMNRRLSEELKREEHEKKY